MIKKIAGLIIILLAVVIQVSILPFFISTDFKPDLLLIIAVYIALRSSFDIGAPLTWLIGLLKDLFSGLYLGLNAFTFLLLFFVIKSSSDRLYAESGELFIVAVSLATIGNISLSMLLSVMFTSSPGVAYSMLSSIIPHLLINAFTASLITLFPFFSSPIQETETP